MTETVTISYDLALAELEAVVAEYGADHVYASSTDDRTCWYVHTVQAPDGTVTHTPGCIVGVWLARRGYDLEAMAEKENGTADVYLPGLLREEIDVRALYLLRQTQAHQDMYQPWGQALSRAQREVAAVDWETDPWRPGEDD